MQGRECRMKVHAWRFGTRAAMTDLTHRLEDVLVLEGLTRPEQEWPFLPMKVALTEVAADPLSYGTRALTAEREWVVKMEVIEDLKRSYSSKFFFRAQSVANVFWCLYETRV